MAIRRQRTLKATFAAAACVVLAACGSAVPPSKFFGAQGGLGGANNGSNGTNGSPGAFVPGATTGAKGAKNGSGGTGGTGNTGTGGGNNGQGNTGGQSNPGNAAAGFTIGSCAGFKNTTGITNSTITLANVADVSGPVPGLFAGAQQAIKAFVAYFNSASSICGRKLALTLLDSQTSSSGDQQAATTACGSSFAMVGSMGAFDDGGAQTVQNCGIPDLRAAATEQARINVPNVFGTMSLNASYIPTEPPKFYIQKFGADVTQHAAMLWLAAGAAQLNGQNEMKGFTDAGMKFVYSSGIDVTAFNYQTYVSAMKSAGVKWVEFVGAISYAVRLAQAMQQQNFTPEFILDPEFYDPSFVQSGGSAVNGVHIWANQLPFEQVSQSPEMQTYETWLQRTSPGAQPNYFGLYAWAAGRLFVQEALGLGGKLTRGSLIDALRGVDNYTGNGLFGPQHVGAKITASCYGFITLQNGKWIRENSGGNYLCGSVVKV
ncbi:MAG TPA: ABC transporter substrate-binding protein [Jatrophihabitantaceae bacterium]|nr:ABC transporter substrate-binding protein [Jatrophihabitantaceae bacterium]